MIETKRHNPLSSLDQAFRQTISLGQTHDIGHIEPVDHPIILFDGVCNFCDASVKFIIKRDPKSRFRFAALQSDTGKKILQQFSLSTTALDTLVLIKKDRCYVRSSAALRIARHLSGLWPLFFGFIIIPPFIRNWVYNFIARRRYQWFGKKESCMIPTPELKERFLT